jgi:Mn2+/Fe2+ NRAMP family transporter
MLIAVNKPAIVKEYKHPLVLQIAGWLVVAAMTWMGSVSIYNLFK